MQRFWVDDDFIKKTYLLRETFNDLVVGFVVLHGELCNKNNKHFFCAIADTLCILLKKYLNAVRPPDFIGKCEIFVSLASNLAMTRKHGLIKNSFVSGDGLERKLETFFTRIKTASKDFRKQNVNPLTTEIMIAPEESQQVSPSRSFLMDVHLEIKAHHNISAKDQVKLLRHFDTMRNVPIANIAKYSEKFSQLLFHSYPVPSSLSGLGIGLLMMTGMDWLQHSLAGKDDIFNENFQGMNDVRIWGPGALFILSILLLLHSVYKDVTNQLTREEKQYLDRVRSAESARTPEEILSESESEQEQEEYKILTGGMVNSY